MGFAQGKAVREERLGWLVRQGRELLRFVLFLSTAAMVGHGLLTGLAMAGSSLLSQDVLPPKVAGSETGGGGEWLITQVIDFQTVWADVFGELPFIPAIGWCKVPPARTRVSGRSCWRSSR